MTNARPKICLTFDIDLAEYASDWKPNNEFEVAVPEITRLLGDFPDVRTTWFVRIDDHVATTWGRPDYFFDRYAPLVDRLRDGGHEIAWHPHSYVRAGERWTQNVDGAGVLDELKRHAPLVHSLGVRSVRMGWGFHTNDTMRFLSDEGFVADSSAIPRPQYRWEPTYKDWQITPQHPYHPSAADYRAPGGDELEILEIPMSVVPLPAPTDTERVLRYINLAYRTEPFARAVRESLESRPILVTITHPYEVLPSGNQHALLAFDLDAFHQNLSLLATMRSDTNGSAPSFVTIAELASAYGELQQ